jgi:hypothetical protein
VRSVAREKESVAAGTDLAGLYKREIEMARRVVSGTPDLLARAVGLNPENWSLVRFDYWACPQGALPGGSHSYEVLHVSAPNPNDLSGVGSVKTSQD